MLRILVISIVTFFSSCCISHKDEYIKLNEETIEWIPYSKNEKILFQRNNNIIDTIAISEYFEGNEIVKNSECGDVTYDTKSFKIKFNVDSIFYVKMSISDVHFYGTAQNASFNWDDNKNEFLNSLPGSAYYFTGYTINGIEYQNVLKIVTQLNNQVTAIYYVKGLGLISIERSDSTSWRKI